MSDYISREAALEKVIEVKHRDPELSGVVLHRYIKENDLKDIPAADVAPVRRGEWIGYACTVLTVTGAEASGTTLKYVIGDRTVKNGDKVTGYTALTSGTTQITATAGKTITVVELDGNARAIKVGKAAAVPHA